MRKLNLEKYVGDRAFYRRVFQISVPMMVANAITNFVSLLDNIMISSLGTEALAGVSIVNQFMFMFQIVVFGAVSAASIFTAQYVGSGDREGVVNTFRFKMYLNLACAGVAILIFLVFGDNLIQAFLHEGEDTGNLALAMEYAKEYLAISLIGLFPFALSQVYASTMRETGNVILPMYASIAAVATNCIGNVILIFGLLGAPALGPAGAAIATTSSRFIELAILAIYAHFHNKDCYYANHCFHSFKIPMDLVRNIIMKGIPIMLNEFFWSLAITMRNQSYSVRGLDAVAAQTIAMTVFSVMSVVYMAVGSAIAIIVGNQLGAGKIEEAEDTACKMRGFGVAVGVVVGGLTAALCGVFPVLFSATPSVSRIATFMLIMVGIAMPFSAYCHSAYFTLRTGGKVLVTVLFDAVWMWALVVPLSLVLANFTSISIYALFAICHLTEIPKCALGMILLKKVKWANRLVVSHAEETACVEQN